jgi:cation transport regulator ChaC
VPEAPGRVVTLVPDPGARCHGIAYRVEPAAWDAVVALLDRRERGGFARQQVEIRFHEDEPGPVPALVYVAGPGNPNYLGPAPLVEIAEQVRRARGPSGGNAEYVLRLAAELRAQGADDPHVFAVARLLADAAPDA